MGNPLTSSIGLKEPILREAPAAVRIALMIIRTTTRKIDYRYNDYTIGETLLIGNLYSENRDVMPILSILPIEKHRIEP